MEKLYKELEETKFSMELLTEECRAKATLSDNLKRVNNEQLAKLQEARAKIEKQAKVIDEKDEEISDSKQMCEDLKSKLSEKESALKHLRLANENFRANSAEKVKQMGEEKKQLLFALEESNSRREEQDNVISSCRQEIERLRGLLSVTQKKCVDAEEIVKVPRDVRRRDEMIAKLEHDKGDVEEQLKWRSEQFRHLEEAHDKIQTKFRTCKKEWDIEKSNLVDEVSSLQTNLDSKTRMAEDLRSKLHMCNQALAREESRRKLLEIQMSESKALYENTMSEYEDTRMNIKSMTARRDEEIAELRNSLATKATLAKELDFRSTHLEQENEQLRTVLKELREDQINGVGAVASFKSLQQKFRALEQAHRGCSEKLKSRDLEWSKETEKLSRELEGCLLKLNKNDKQLQCLQTELAVSNSLSVQQKLEYEEISVVLLLLKSKFLESCSVFEDLKHHSELHIKKMEEKTCLLMEHLDMKNRDLVQAQAEIKRQHEKVSSLLSKVEYSESVEQEYLRLQMEINSYKVMLEESSKSIEQLKEQATRREINLLEDIKKALAALDEANSALAEKSNQLSEVEFGLEQSMLAVDRMENIRCDLETELKKCHDENLSIRNDLEDSSLARLEAEKELEEREDSFLQTLTEKEKKIEGLQQQLAVLEEHMHVLESSVMDKVDSEKLRKTENEKFLQCVEDTDRMLRFTQNKVYSLEQNYVLREIGSLMKLEEEKIRFQEGMAEKEKVITDLQHKLLLYEQDFSRSVEIAASIKQRDAKMELCSLNEALERTLSAGILDKQEICYKNGLVAGLEEEILSLHHKAEDEKMSSVGILMQLEEEVVRLLHVMEEKERVIADMHKEVLLYEQDFSRSVEIAASIKQRDAKMELCSLNEALERTLSAGILDKQEICYKNGLVAGLEEEILSLHHKAEEEKMSSVGILMQLEEEVVRLLHVMEEKERVIAALHKKVLLYEQDFSRSVEIAASIKQRDAEMELYSLNEALERALSAAILDKQEICYKNGLVAGLEEEILSLHHKAEEEKMSSAGILMQLEEEVARLLQVMEEKERVIADMHKKDLLYEQDFSKYVEIAASIKQRDTQMELCTLYEALEKTVSVHILDKLEIYYQSYLVTELDEEILSVQMKAEEEKMESIEILMILEEEKSRFQQVMEGRGKVIADMQQKILSHEQDFSRCVEIAGSIRDAQMELSTLNNAIENILAVCIIDKQEIYYRNNLVAELEEEIRSLQQKAEFEGKLSLSLKNHADELEVKLATVLLEREKEKVQFDIELKNLQHAKATLESLAKLCISDREELITQMMMLGEKIGNISDEGEEYKRKWERVMQMATDENAISRDVEVEDETSSRKVHGKNIDSPSRSKAGPFLCRRSPLKEQNC